MLYIQWAPYFPERKRITGLHQPWATLGLALGPFAFQILSGCCQNLETWSVVLATKAALPSWWIPGQGQGQFACLAELREVPPERGRRGGTWQKPRLLQPTSSLSQAPCPRPCGIRGAGEREMSPRGNYCSPSPINHSSFPSSVRQVSLQPGSPHSIINALRL